MLEIHKHLTDIEKSLAAIRKLLAKDDYLDNNWPAADTALLEKRFDHNFDPGFRYRFYSRHNIKPSRILGSDCVRDNQSNCDFVVYIDYLDHLPSQESIVNTLLEAKKAISKPGKILTRMHPWTSRNGGHQSGIFNKAFLHLYYTPEELEQLGCQNTLPHLPILRPLLVYETIFNECGLSVDSRQINQSTDWYGYFSEHMPRIIKNIWDDSVDITTAIKIMSINFVDYILSMR